MADQHGRACPRGSVPAAVQRARPVPRDLDVVNTWESKLAVLEQEAVRADSPESRVAVAAARAEVAVARARAAAELATVEVTRFASHGGGR
ncbi:hypothetical protein F4561_004569 [Lipingzhangella halophila]|uniref:Uncharacterized protein n=1 Tax=Lipingzhangella halophila TaxID=1783352 RepID=A0A7W7W5E1_9ACTN|nr:hypothetical protein [Lipingzhangella halophila]